MDELILTTDNEMRKKNDLKSLLVLFVVFSGVLLFFVYSRGVGIILGTEALLFLALAFAYYKSAKNGDVTLHFKGDSLDISYSDGRKYNIKDVDRSFFTLLQTENQKALNVGTLTVQSTNFKVQYIKNFDSLQQYMETHFEKTEKKSIYYFDEEDED